jgi:hypothetical protein
MLKRVTLTLIWKLDFQDTGRLPEELAQRSGQEVEVDRPEWVYWMDGKGG